MAGLLTPTAGSVSVLGLTPSERPPELLRRLGLVVVTAVAIWVTSRLWNRELRNYAGAMG